MQVQTGSANQKTSPPSRQVSESSSNSGVKSQSSEPTEPPSSPQTKTAGDVKAQLLNFTSDGELGEGQESLPSPNGNLR